MRPLKITAAFLARAALFYALLVIPWPGLRSTYAAGYRAVANKLFGHFGSDGAVRFRAITPGPDLADTEFDLGNRRTGAMRSARHNSRVTGYLPTAETIALILATPIPWRRKWKALLAGLALAYALIALRLSVALLYGFASGGPVALFHPSPWAQSALTMLFNVIVAGISFTYVAPFFLWLAVAVRSADIETWLRPVSHGAAPGAAGTPRRRRAKAQP